MISLPPWASGPFELLLHAEGHLIKGEDIDRRIALISFDNAIETTIATYLTLNPIQRGGKTYPSADVEKWLNNYHAKLDFLEAELIARGLPWIVERGHIVWVHDHRNEQYHGGHKGAPEKKDLKIIRDAALWIFGTLFVITEVEKLLAQAIIDSSPSSPPKSDENFDKAIDGAYGIIEVGEQSYYASDLLFSVDYEAYKELGAKLNKEEATASEERKSDE